MVSVSSPYVINNPNNFFFLFLFDRLAREKMVVHNLSHEGRPLIEYISDGPLVRHRYVIGGDKQHPKIMLLHYLGNAEGVWMFVCVCVCVCVAVNDVDLYALLLCVAEYRDVTMRVHSFLPTPMLVCVVGV